MAQPCTLPCRVWRAYGRGPKGILSPHSCLQMDNRSERDFLLFFGRLFCVWGASTQPGKPAPSWEGTRSSLDTPSLEKKNKPRSSCSACQGKLSRAKLAPSCHRLSPAKSPAASTTRKGHGSLSQRSHLQKPPLLVNTPGKGTIIPSNSIPTFLHPPTHGFAAQKAANNPSGRELCCNQGLHAMSKALITTVILEA